MYSSEGINNLIINILFELFYIIYEYDTIQYTMPFI